MNCEIELLYHLPGNDKGREQKDMETERLVNEHFLPIGHGTSRAGPLGSK